MLSAHFVDFIVFRLNDCYIRVFDCSIRVFDLIIECGIY